MTWFRWHSGKGKTIGTESGLIGVKNGRKGWLQRYSMKEFSWDGETVSYLDLDNGFTIVKTDITVCDKDYM